LLGCLVVLGLGCGGGRKFVPVSGRVTLNGQPLANATVSFQPVAPEGALEAGPGSTGKTNEKGEFSLQVLTGQAGAVVGKHRVQISALDAQVESDKRPPRGGWPLANRLAKAKGIPEAFEVPPGGTDAANFALTAP
jgi:hypothetical protein